MWRSLLSSALSVFRRRDRLDDVAAAQVEMGSTGANDLIRSQLRGLRDDGTVIRHVVHYCCPLGALARPPIGLNGADRAAAIEVLEANGMTVRPEEQMMGPESLVFEHRSEVASPEFDRLTMSLRTALEERGWHYDGWECEVVSKGATPA